MIGGGGGEEGSRLLEVHTHTHTPPRVSWGLPTAVLRALWGTQSTQDPRAERNLLAKSENVPKAGLHSQSHARMLCSNQTRSIALKGQQAERGSGASLQEIKDHRRQLAVLAVLHAEDLFGMCMCPKWTGSETPGVHHDFTWGSG